MLKKILSIIFIICLVFSLTVPCFAYTEVGGALVVENLGFFKHFTQVNSGSSYQTTNIGTFPVISGHRYAFYCYSDPYSSTATSSTPGILIYNNLPTQYSITLNNMYEHTPQFVTATGTGNAIVQFVSYTAGTYDYDFAIFVFDVTGQTNIKSTFDNYNFNVRNNYQRGNVTLFIDGFTGEEIPEFLSSTLHTFDFLGLSTVPYIPLLIVFFGITAILTFIFVIVFMIKRLTGGS